MFRAKRVKEGEEYFYIGVVTVYNSKEGIDGHEFRVTPKNDNRIDTDELNFITRNYFYTKEQAEAALALRNHEIAIEKEYGEIKLHEECFIFDLYYGGNIDIHGNGNLMSVKHSDIDEEQIMNVYTNPLFAMSHKSTQEQRDERARLLEKAISVFNK